MKKWASLFIVILISSSRLNAEALSLPELIDIALKNNPETEKAWSSVKRSQAILGLAKSNNYPTLDASGLLMHGREVKYPNGPNTVFTNYGAELCLNYLLFDFGERNATVRAAKDALIASRYSSDFAMQKIVYTVAASYYEYINAVELLATKECSLHDAETIFSAAEDLCQAGLRNKNDFSTSSAAVAQIQMDLSEQRAQVAIAYGKLITYLGLPIETTLEVDRMPQGIENPLFAEGIPALIDAAKEQRADLLAKQATLSEMNERVTRAKRAPLPKLRGLAEGGWMEYAKHNGNGYNYTAGLTLDVPIFRGFEYSYQKRLAVADADMTLAELKELNNNIALELVTFSESAKAAGEAYRWSERYLEEATKSYEGALESYKAGLQNIFDLLQSQRYLADARIRKTQARTQWLVSIAQLAFATGSLMK